MDIAQKSKIIQDQLNLLFPKPPIPLDHVDAYSLLIAVLLSAQCTDERVNKVTPLLFAIASTPESMVDLGVDAIEEIIRPCGLSKAKSKAIHRLSEILIAEHQGKVPDDMAALERLPGVGHKTASVLMIQAFGQPAFPVDTHIQRLALRWGLSNSENVVHVERDLKAIFPMDTWAKLHLQIIYFGRLYCKARGHKAADCPICSLVEGRD